MVACDKTVLKAVIGSRVPITAIRRIGDLLEDCDARVCNFSLEAVHHMVLRSEVSNAANSLESNKV